MNKKKEEIKKRKALDNEWAKMIKERDGGVCAYCGSDKKINAHHILPREINQLRYNLDNGISLCPKHHKFSYEFSAHKNSFVFMIWFQANRKEQFLRLCQR